LKNGNVVCIVLSEFVKQRRVTVRQTLAELAEKAGVVLRFVREVGKAKKTFRLDKVN